MPSKIYVTDRILPPNRVRTYDSQASTNAGVIATVPCTVLRVIGFNKATTGTLYLLLFDSATVPADGATPMIQTLVLAGGAQAPMVLADATGEGLLGLATLAGLSWAASTTSGTLTLDTTSSVRITARFI